MEYLGYYNGRYGDLNEIKADILDRGLYFGDGVYDVAYCYNKKVFALDEHVDRFFSAAELLDLNLGINKKDLYSLIYNLLDKVDGEKLIIYWHATRGSMIRDHFFPDNIRANLLITIKPGELRDINQSIKVCLSDDLRHKMCNIKTLNLLPNVMALYHAEKNKCQEVIFHREGRITECAHSNVSILKNGVLITPPADNCILAGTGRAHLMATARELNIKVKEEKFYKEDLFDADEIILTAAGSLCIDVIEISGISVGKKDRDRIISIRKKLANEFNKYTDADIEVKQ